MNITRRNLATALLGTTALAACGTTTLTPTLIITEAGTVANGLAGAITQIATAYPALIPAATLVTIKTDLGLAQTAATGLSAALPATTGASVVQTIEGYINAVLTVLAGPPINGLIPAPFNMAISAAALLVPDLEAFANTYLAPTAAASLAAAHARAMLVVNAPPITDKNAALLVLAGYAKK